MTVSSGAPVPAIPPVKPENPVSGRAGGGTSAHVIAIDPGYEQSAYVLFDGVRLIEHRIEPNEALAHRLHYRTDQMDHHAITAVVFEQIESFGMAVGREVFETVFWTGRLFEVARATFGPVIQRMPRRAVKLHLCQSARAQDSNIRTALLDRFGGRDQAVGKKATPGPLFGIKSHEWAALAIAVTWWDQRAGVAR